ncbi:MAG TPA: flagellar biosynthetic protein FliO [Peptococcaceae bacterium]|jgi:flagellar biogenesis protein FliO|nr:FliO/MopB family protein [Clostridia bacterium]HOB81323.1 flagellar biosynthetic protein FliO [Peptococcaceae bacterium]HPZ70599.1 flagellar biosynthetic protein FliO [Peptococcaceae bacterium]HQD53409.1 flagellar biosynthetic protein FliO [Peptococcaceae bacterium]
MDNILIFLSAMENESTAVQNVMELPSTGALLFRIVLSLLIIVFVVYFVLRIINQQQKLRDNQRKWVKILDYQPLGTNRGLYLMELYDITCIVAVSDGEIKILKELDTTSNKWREIQEQLQELDTIVPSGVIKFLQSKLPHKNKIDSQKYFQQQLAEQLRKSEHLSQEILKGRETDE